MHTLSLTSLLSFYGFFLICCGIISILLIGPKAKTALLSGGTMGIISLALAYLIYLGHFAASIAGIVLCLGLFIVFSWRAAKTLHTIFEMVPSAHKDLKGKGIAFLIISLMAVVSIVVLMLLVVF